MSSIAVRPFAPEDLPLLARLAHRLLPADGAVSPRDPESFRRYFDRLAGGRLPAEPGAETFVATIDGEAAGTGHSRAYVDILVVAPESEGQGVGQMLLRHIEAWARDRGCREVVLDVFTGNEAAFAFYARRGYRPDHVRLTKLLP
jgi:ribosomal protein S18 acetylase RimI-like enzyme